MADKYIQYVVQEGERWDTISHKMYGTPYEIERLILNNPKVPVTERLAGGTVLEVPVLEIQEVKPNPAVMPPWKR